MADTDNARISELNSKVSSAYSKTASDPQNANDLALARLAANTEILNLKGTRTNP